MSSPPDRDWSPASTPREARDRNSLWSLSWRLYMVALLMPLAFLPVLYLDSHQAAGRDRPRTTGSRLAGPSVDKPQGLPSHSALLWGGIFCLCEGLTSGFFALFYRSREPLAEAGRSPYFGPRPDVAPEPLAAPGSAGPGASVHEVTLLGLPGGDSAATVKGPWTRRKGKLWTNEIDVRLVQRANGRSHWWRVYASGACVPLALYPGAGPGSHRPLFLDAHRDAHPSTPGGEVSGEVFALTLGVLVHEDAEHHPSAWVAESSRGLDGLPDRVRQTIEDHPEVLATVLRSDVTTIRAYETVVDDRAPVTFVGTWPEATEAAEPYRDLATTKPTPTAEQPGAYLFLGSQDVWKIWLGKRQRVTRWIHIHLAVAIVLLVTGVALLAARASWPLDPTGDQASRTLAA